MKPIKIAMMSLTHGHTRKYFQTLRDSPRLEWIAASAADDVVRQRFHRAVDGVPCYASDEEMLDRPELVRTMSVKPPIGFGRVRLLRIEGVDLQPCGGTHVASTAEVGALRIAKIEKKSARTRRVTIEFAQEAT